MPERRPRTVLSAYIDGKSRHIEALKLNAVDRLEKAQEDSQGELTVMLDGQRHSRTKDLALFAGLGLAPTALAAYAGSMLNGSTGALVGGALGVGAFALPSLYFLGRAWKASQWTPETRYTPSEAARPTPIERPGAQRLRSLVEENQSGNPQARHLLFVSGHGDRSSVAGMAMDDLSQAMEGSQLDLTILDACLQAQLEVLTRMAPWAGLILASPHKIKARGFDLQNMLKPQILRQDSKLAMAEEMARIARSTAPSFAVIDSGELKASLLPCLDKLGSCLATALEDPSKGRSVRRALKRAPSTDGLISRRVDLGGFLKELGRQGVLPELTREANKLFKQAVPFQENEHSISFHVTEGKNDTTLPEGWRTFLKALDCSFKPIF